MGECASDLMSREVESCLGLTPDERMLLCHTEFCLSGPAPNGYVQANVYDTLFGTLREQYPDAVIEQQLLYVWEMQSADPNGLHYGVECLCSGEGGSTLSFPLTQMGYYEVLTTIQLPQQEFMQEYAEETPVAPPMETPLDADLSDPVPAAQSTDETTGDTEVDAGAAPHEVFENAEEDSPSSPADAVDETVDEAPDPLAGMIYISPCEYAPSGYLMLNINAAPDEGTCWAFDGYRMLATTNGSYRMLIPAEYVSAGLLTPDGRALVTEVPDEAFVSGLKGDVNQDGVVNIADANIILQLIKEGFAYYDMEQLTPQQRMQADVDGDLMYSIADVNEIVYRINNGIV